MTHRSSRVRPLPVQNRRHARVSRPRNFCPATWRASSVPSVNYCDGSTAWARIWPSGSRKSARSRCSWRRGWWPSLATSSVGGRRSRQLANSQAPDRIFEPAQPVLSREGVSVRSARPPARSRAGPRSFDIHRELFAEPARPDRLGTRLATRIQRRMSSVRGAAAG